MKKKKCKHTKDLVCLQVFFRRIALLLLPMNNYSTFVETLAVFRSANSFSCVRLIHSPYETLRGKINLVHVVAM